ncbi:transmembrane protein [Legionella sainthelensi]|uniref:hypothetical protein n=1 Tax=Legionella sainthelensi TaxID=28087 RepID=UPI000F6B50E6|nr:hypothetical protein [Legionella sainthelensi]VEB34143.1 transmembrane protein [Legionella sainthelensi]
MPSFSAPKKNAKNLHQWTYLYALYLGIDNGKLSMSMIKYSFDIALANSDLATKAMQEWIKSPIGASVATLVIFGTISASLITHYTIQEDKIPFRIIILLWPYVRDSMKSLRNALRGISSTLNLIYILEFQDIRHLIIPIGLFVGGLSVLNRIWIRWKSNQYHELLDINAQLIVDLEKLNTLSPQQIDSMRRKIAKQSNAFKTCSLFASFLSGLIDGINPYIGSLVLVTCSPSMLLLITSFCGVYFFITLAIRVHEEMNLQQEFLTVQKKIELTLLEKEIDLLTTYITQLSDYLILHSRHKELFLDEYTTLSIYLNSKLEEQEKERKALSQITRRTPIYLQGAQIGLNAYKYVMLTFSTCIFLSPIKLPALSSEHRALVGMSSLGAGISYTFSASFLRQWIESMKSYFKSDNSQNNCCLTHNNKISTSFQNTNSFFFYSKQQERPYLTSQLCKINH